MTMFGKANYEGYREFSHGKSLVSGDPIPEWDALPVHIQSAWNAGADGVALELADLPVDEDMPGGEPQAATVIVKTDTGAEIRFTAGEFDADGQLDIRDTSRKANNGIVASYAPGRWNSVRLDGVTEPDTARRQLTIAREALALIARSNPEDPRKVAHDALDDIWAEDA